MARLDDLPRDEAAEPGGLAAAVAARRGARRRRASPTWSSAAAGQQWPVACTPPGLRSLRVRAATYADALEDVVDRGLRTGDPLAHGEGLLTMGPLKVISDGSLNTRTAYCCTPYADDPGAAVARRTSPPDELTELLTRARPSTGCARRCTPSATPRSTAALGRLRAQPAPAARSSTPSCWRPGHAPRMARLGVIASVQPAHLLDDRDVTELCWSDRGERCFTAAAPCSTPACASQLGSDAPGRPAGPVAGDGRCGPPQRRRARALEPRPSR